MMLYAFYIFVVVFTSGEAQYSQSAACNNQSFFEIVPDAACLRSLRSCNRIIAGNITSITKDIMEDSWSGGLGGMLKNGLGLASDMAELLKEVGEPLQSILNGALSNSDDPLRGMISAVSGIFDIFYAILNSDLRTNPAVEKYADSIFERLDKATEGIRCSGHTIGGIYIILMEIGRIVMKLIIAFFERCFIKEEDDTFCNLVEAPVNITLSLGVRFFDFVETVLPEQ